MSGHRYPLAKGGGGMSSLARRWRLLSVQAFGRSGPLVLSRVASAALTFGLPLVLVRVLDPHSFGTYKQFFLVAQTLLLVGQLGLTQSLYYFLPRGAAQRGAPRWSLLRRQLAYALPFAGSSLLYVVHKYLPQYVVSACFDPATFALFAVASFHLPVIDIIYTPTSEVLMVELGRRESMRDLPGAVRHWQDSIERLATLLFPAAVGSWLVGPILLPMLFTADYAPAVPLFMLATAEIPLWIFPCDAVLRASGDTRFLFRFNAVRLLVTAVLVLAGIRLLGIQGAIGAAIVAESLGCAVLLSRAGRYLRVSTRDLVDWRAPVRIATCAALAVVPALALRFVLPGGPQLLIASVLVYSAAYFTVRAVLGRSAVATTAPFTAGLIEK